MRFHLSPQALFYSMMKHVAEEATLIIPVVSFLTLRANFSAIWTEWDTTLPPKKRKDRILMVVVSKVVGMDHNQIHFNIIRAKIADKVWKTRKRCNRVLFCDSLIGLGAMQLEGLLKECIEDQMQETAGRSPEIRVIYIQNPSSSMRLPYLKSL